jgi:hypothetical protein
LHYCSPEGDASGPHSGSSAPHFGSRYDLRVAQKNGERRAKTQFGSAYFTISVRLVPKLFAALHSGNFSAANGFTWMQSNQLRGKDRVHSLVQKFRNFLEASWALSPTMVGMACLTLDLAALLHWRLKATHSALAYRQVRSRE